MALRGQLAFRLAEDKDIPIEVAAARLAEFDLETKRKAP